MRQAYCHQEMIIYSLKRDRVVITDKNMFHQQTNSDRAYIDWLIGTKRRCTKNTGGQESQKCHKLD